MSASARANKPRRVTLNSASRMAVSESEGEHSASSTGSSEAPYVPNKEKERAKKLVNEATDEELLRVYHSHYRHG